MTRAVLRELSQSRLASPLQRRVRLVSALEATLWLNLRRFLAKRAACALGTRERGLISRWLETPPPKCQKHEKAVRGHENSAVPSSAGFWEEGKNSRPLSFSRRRKRRAHSVPTSNDSLDVWLAFLNSYLLSSLRKSSQSPIWTMEKSSRKPIV